MDGPTTDKPPFNLFNRPRKVYTRLQKIISFHAEFMKYRKLLLVLQQRWKIDGNKPAPKPVTFTDKNVNWTRSEWLDNGWHQKHITPRGYMLLLAPKGMHVRVHNKAHKLQYGKKSEYEFRKSPPHWKSQCYTHCYAQCKTRELKTLSVLSDCRIDYLDFSNPLTVWLRVGLAGFPFIFIFFLLFVLSFFFLFSFCICTRKTLWIK